MDTPRPSTHPPTHTHILPLEPRRQNQAVSELYTRRKWIGQAAGEAALLVTSKAFEGEGEFLRMVLPLLTPLLKGKDGSTLQVRRREVATREIIS